ncbi:MAG: chemotaxis protein CheW [Alteromonadaceae bacterium]|nr:MAG: chemotaxis protein CheW [Alteromonadaceae bacterium]
MNNVHEINKPNAINELVLFDVESMLCGIDIVHVQEINKTLDFTTVHRAPDFVKGVLNLRGSIVSIIDLRTKLGQTTIPLNRDMRVIIVRYNDENVGLLVDAINDVIEVKAENFDALVNNSTNVNSAYFSGVYKLEEELVVILNVEEVLKNNDRVSSTLNS